MPSDAQVQPDLARDHAASGRRPALVCAAALAVLYLFPVSDLWWPARDSALYMGLGRSLAEGNGYRFNGQIETSVTPGLPAMLAGFRIAFGPGCLAANLTMALCGLAALAMIYLSLERLAGRSIALPATLATGLTLNAFGQCHRVLTDGPGLLLFWAILCACLRYLRGGRWPWLVLAGVLSAMMIAVRAPGILAIGALAAGLAVDTSLGAALRRRLWAGGVILAAAVATAGIFYLLAKAAATGLPAYLAHAVDRPRSGLAGHAREIVAGMLQLPSALAEGLTDQARSVWVGLPVIALAAIGGWRLWHRGARLMPVLLALYLLGLCVARGSLPIRPRYMLPVTPIIFWLVVLGTEPIVRAIAARRSRANSASWAAATAVVLAAAMVLCNAPRVMRESFYYGGLAHFTSRFEETFDHGKPASFQAAAKALSENFPPGTKVLCDSEKVRILHYLSGARMVPFNSRDAACETAAEAQAAYRTALAEADRGAIVIDVRSGGRDYRDQLRSLLESGGSFRPVYTGPGWYWVYRRTGAAATEAPPLPPKAILAQPDEDD